MKTWNACLFLFLTCVVPMTHAATSHRTRNVALVLYDGVELLDFAGPGEVFSAAANRAGAGDTPWFDVYTVAPTKDPLVAQGFVTIVPEHDIRSAPKPDIVIVPGGGSSRLTDDPAFMAWFAEATKNDELTLTVCTGAFVAAKAGLLDGKGATTHWGSIDRLREAAPKATINDSRRFVDSGRVVTSAGVSAGIDGSLHVIARLLGRAAAEGTARYMEYNWQPDPQLAPTYDWLNPQLNPAERDYQQLGLLMEAGRTDEAAAQVRALTTSRPEDAAAWYELGKILHEQKSWDDAMGANRKAIALSPKMSRAHYNLACELALTGRKDEAFAALRAAIDAGFKQRGFLNWDPDIATLRADPRFALLIEQLPPS